MIPKFEDMTMILLCDKRQKNRHQRTLQMTDLNVVFVRNNLDYVSGACAFPYARERACPPTNCLTRRQIFIKTGVNINPLKVAPPLHFLISYANFCGGSRSSIT
jgi:hypothetical protein